MEDLQDYAFGQWLKSRHLQKKHVWYENDKRGKRLLKTL